MLTARANGNTIEEVTKWLEANKHNNNPMFVHYQEENRRSPQRRLEYARFREISRNSNIKGDKKALLIKEFGADYHIYKHWQTIEVDNRGFC